MAHRGSQHTTTAQDAAAHACIQGRTDNQTVVPMQGILHGYPQGNWKRKEILANATTQTTPNDTKEVDEAIYRDKYVAPLLGGS